MRLGLSSHGNRLPTEKTSCVAHSIIVMELAYRTKKSYFVQVFWEECKLKVQDKTKKNI